MESPFPVYKIGDSLFQIGDLNIDFNYKQNIISILNLGNKFVPNYFFNAIDFFNYLLKELDENLLDLNTSIFLSKNKSSISKKKYDSSDNNLNDFTITDEYFKHIFKKMHTKYKIRNEKLFISKEINQLRSDIHSKIFDEYDNILIKPNINYLQYKDLIRFQKEKSFKIINCDKNVGIAILSNELYSTSVIEFLNSDTTFSDLTEDPLYTTVNSIKNDINNLFNNGHVSTNLHKNILKNIDESKLGSFRLLAKLHKPKFSWRPIINCKNHPNSNICNLIDQLLRPIVTKTETYIKDSQNLIQKTKDLVFDKEPYIYSLDIVSLYTNIIPNNAIDKITHFMRRFLDCFDIDIIGLNKLLKIMFNTNVFKFDTKFYRQIKGLPMGCICGPMVANLYVYILEMKWHRIEKPLVDYRFIDDKILILDKELNFLGFQKYFENLEFTLSHDKKIVFLDILLEYDRVIQKLKYSVYIKPTNSFGYLKTNSNHPSHIFNAIPISLFIRNRRICTNFSDFIIVSKMQIEQLVKRGYNRSNLVKICKTISNYDRNSLLPYKEKINNFLSEEENFILYFHFFNYNLNIQSIIYNCFKSIYSNIKLKYINKINCNLNNALIHNFKLNKFTRYKTKKCNLINCKICKFIYARHYIQLNKYSNMKIKLMSNASCTSTNLIYIIICLKCNLFYIGETSETLEKRISQHLNHIKKFKPFEKYHEKEVAKHFRTKGHNLRYFKICVFRAELYDINIRKNYELDLINRFNINKKRCINIIKSKYNKNFIFK